MTFFIGIDIGTTHTKAVVLTEEGQPVFEAKKGYGLLHPEPGYEEQDPVAILAAVEEVMQQSFRTIPATGRIAAVSFSAAMHSILAVDRHHQPLCNAIIWADTRATKEAAAIAALPQAATLFRNTGVPVHPMSPLCKIRWLKNNRPDIAANAYKFISIKEFVLHRLFGKYIVDHSIASATGLFHTQEKQWDAAALEIAGITVAQLSETVSPLHAEQELTPYYSALFKPGGPVPFIIGGSDGCLANLGSGAILPGETALTIGTSGAVRMTLDKPGTTGSQPLFTYILADDIYIRGGAINNGGIVLKWLAGLFLSEQEISDNHFEPLLWLAQKAPPGSGNLLFLPYLLGERAPVWDANAKGALVGLTMTHRKEHIIRAALEGICFTLAQVIHAMEEAGHEIKEVYVSGGFIQSPFWIQLLADITGKKLNVTEAADASATGAAYLGMYATGFLSDLAETKKFIPVTKVYEPNLALHRLYTEKAVLFDSLYPKLKNDFFTLNNDG